MNTTPLAETYLPEQKQPSPKSFWRKINPPTPRWLKWYSFWMILTALALGAVVFFIVQTKSHDAGCVAFAIWTTASYMMGLAGLVRSFVKEK